METGNSIPAVRRPESIDATAVMIDDILMLAVQAGEACGDDSLDSGSLMLSLAAKRSALISFIASH